MKKIAFFDFDGTITSKDTLLEIIKHQKGRAALYIGLAINLPYLAGLKLRLVSNQLAKEKVLRYFFRGADERVFQQACDVFTIENLPAMLRPKALIEIKRLKDLGFEIVIVSASAHNWIKKWSDGEGIKLIASELEISQNRLTGNLKGKNCNGMEKAIRIREAFDLSEYDEIYCYGDTRGDNIMLSLGTKAFYKPFRE